MTSRRPTGRPGWFPAATAAPSCHARSWPTRSARTRARSRCSARPAPWSSSTVTSGTAAPGTLPTGRAGRCTLTSAGAGSNSSLTSVPTRVPKRWPGSAPPRGTFWALPDPSMPGSWRTAGLSNGQGDTSMTSYKMVYGDEDNMVTETYANIDSVVREDGWLVLFRGPEAIVRVQESHVKSFEQLD